MKKPALKLGAAFLSAVLAFGSMPVAPAMAVSNPCSDVLVSDVPDRRAGAAGGGNVISNLSNSAGSSRDAAVLAQLYAGNIPDFLRDLQPVTMRRGQGGPEITICVMPDYLSVGSNSDFVRVPMGMEAALSVATRFGFVLPTTRMVDAIYRQADVRLSPSPMSPTSAMTTTNYFYRHNQTVENQRGRSGASLGALMAGHKKDLVITARMLSRPDRVPIYGWHQRNGSPIQPLSLVHGEDYADYSHGVRLVSSVVFVNGQARSIYDVMADRNLAPILSDEGAIPRLRQLIERESDFAARVPPRLQGILRP